MQTIIICITSRRADVEEIRKEGEASGSQGRSTTGTRRTTHHQGTPVLSYWSRIKLIPNSTINVTHDFTEGEPNTKIYSLKFDKQDKYIAAACENGEVRVYNVKASINDLKYRKACLHAQVNEAGSTVQLCEVASRQWLV